MKIQVFHPEYTCDTVASPSNDKQIADRLLSSCVTEVKQTRDVAKKTVKNDGSPYAAARAMLDELEYTWKSKVRIKDVPSGRAMLSANSKQQVQLVLIAMSSLVQDRYSDWILDRICEDLLNSLLRRKLTYDASEIAQMLTMFQADSIVYNTLPVRSILTNVRRHIEQNGMTKSVRTKLKKLATTFQPNAYSAVERKVGLQIKEILDNEPVAAIAKTQNPIDAQPKLAKQVHSESQAFDINTGEAWTNSLLIELGKLDDESRNHWHQLLEHCGAAKSSKPTKKWLKQSAVILDLVGQNEFVQVLTPTLTAIGQPGESQRLDYGGFVRFSEPTQIHDTRADLLRGLVWATSCFDDDDLIGVVGDAAEKCFQKIREVGPRCPKVGNACLYALSSLASESAVAQLARLQSRAKHVSTRKQIAKAFERAAESAGISRADLVELGVPRFGITEPGTYAESFGDFEARVMLHANKKPELVWLKSNGKTQKTVPVAVKSDHADEWRALQKKLKDIDKLMPSIQHRIEQLLLNGRSWSLSDFRNRFLDHGVVGVVARRLIWNLEIDAAATPVFWHDGNFVDANNRPIEASEEQTRVTIWHPMQSSSDEVLQWRQWLEANQISQPFKQAHREIYVLTDAERETAVYSNRFASHIVRQHQLAALCNHRGWRYDLQGDWDSWNAPFLELPDHGLQVEFYVEPLEELNEVTESFIYTHLSTDQVKFKPLRPAGKNHLDQPIALENIPPLVFSEVMRDVDLFVGVTSVGNDPQWQSRGGETFTDYWTKFSFGELSQTAVTRKQTLQNVVPRLGIADQCRVDDRYLIVKGKLRTYKIHLGSGNVLMSPDDHYLCIVQKRGSGTKRTDNIYLPFEGDNTLSLILSKAFLLANDDNIKDATITNQIRLDRD